MFVTVESFTADRNCSFRRVEPQLMHKLIACEHDRT